MSAPRLVVVTGIVLAGMLNPAVPFAKTAKDAKVPITTKNEKARAAYLEGRDLFEKLRITDSRASFERAVELDPKFGLALLNLANSQPSAREFNEVIERAVAASGKVSKGEKLMILSAQAGGQGDNATQIKLLKELTDLYPEDERAWTLYGNAFFATQEWGKAVDAFVEATRINPEYSQPYNQMGYSYKFLNKLDAAESAFKKYVELIPDDPNPYDSYAELLMKRGRYDESIAMYKKALGVDVGFASARYGIASDYDFQHKLKEALAEMDQALEVAKDDGQRRGAHFARAVSYAHGGDLAGAQSAIEKQYEIAVANHDTLAMIGDLNLMGTIALEQADVDVADKRFAAARGLIESAVTLPARNKANQQRFQKFLQGRVALARGDVAAAGKWSEEFAAEANASGNAGQKLLVHELAGQVAMASKEPAKAVEAFEKSNLLDPYNLYRLSLAHAAAGNEKKAKEYAELARTDNTLTSLNYAFVLRAMAGTKQMSTASD